MANPPRFYSERRQTIRMPADQPPSDLSAQIERAILRAVFKLAVGFIICAFFLGLAIAVIRAYLATA